ncbi:enhanced intracellular survival protein Eis [Mycobacterium sp. 2YAF39]|uniref:enhanced intracellular survival protein Eis n=1 Tax=Mycobacterium sp. 2YAF39 TaxID=3233033 RepID=UPI003F9AAB62
MADVSVAAWNSVLVHDTSTSVNIRTALDADWPGILLLDATCFGRFGHPDTFAAWRSMIPRDGSVVASDGGDIIGMSHYLDLTVTVPGGAVVPVAGVTLVAVAPTHRRRGVLRAMYTEMHDRIADARYPIAALTASEGGIYGRFGYGPATTEVELTVDRTRAQFRADAPDPLGVRLVQPTEHSDEFAAIYDRWRMLTPGAQVRPQALWDELLADRADDRRGGTELFSMLHTDGYALYRVFGDKPMMVRVAELTAVTTEAHIALSRALLGLDLMDKVAFGTHPADPLPYLLTDARHARVTYYEDDLWLRLMDIPAALQARSYRGDLTAVLEVSDGFRSDGGRFALEIGDGRARCVPTGAPADVSMDLDVLGSIYFGSHRASIFAAANRLRSNDSELIARLDAAFASDVCAQLGFGF